VIVGSSVLSSHLNVLDKVVSLSLFFFVSGIFNVWLFNYSHILTYVTLNGRV